MKRKGFTLLEIIIAVTGFFIIMTVVINAYFSTVNYRYSFQAKSTLLETTYYMFEKINLLLKDYTIDYEEYFNRSRVGCDTLGIFTGWNVGTNGYCNQFTALGNSKSFGSITGQHGFYYCTSIVGVSGFNIAGPNVKFGTGCAIGMYQSFGQYTKQFFDVKQNTDGNPSVIDDSDDTDLGKGPEAILQSTGVKELYLISRNKQYRVFLRRALIATGEFDGKPGLTSDTESLYSLQILKLKSFDAGVNHDFNASNTGNGVYDGIIDTWSCDYAQGFICPGTGLGNNIGYSGYKIPLNISQYNSGWVDLFDSNITVTDWNIEIYPSKDPDLSWSEPNYQLSPYFVISVKTKLYGGFWHKKLRTTTNDYQFTLQTTFAIKNY